MVQPLERIDVTSVYDYFNTSNVMVQLGLLNHLIQLDIYFNTSNVMVQLNTFGYEYTKKTNFNTSNVMVQHKNKNLLLYGIKQFQYIKCDGSALPSHVITPSSTYFNTSNVMVQRNVPVGYVQVQQISIHQMWWFSASKAIYPACFIWISIHQMWWFS